METFEAEMYLEEGDVSRRIAIVVKADDKDDDMICLRMMYPAAGQIYLTKL